MHSEKQVRGAMKARKRHALQQARCIVAMLANVEAEDLTAEDMQALRDVAEELLQDVHEFNAYRNVALT